VLGRVLPSQKIKEKRKLGRIVKFKFLFTCLIRKNTVKIYKASSLQPVLFLYFGCHKLIMNYILVFILVIKFNLI